MKNLKITLMCLAAAAMTFTACSDADEFEPNKENTRKDITFIVENPDVNNDTRTDIMNENGKLVPYWGTIENLNLYVDEGGSHYEIYYYSETQTPVKTTVFQYNTDGPSIGEGATSCVGLIENTKSWPYPYKFYADNTVDIQYSDTQEAFNLTNTDMKDDVLVTDIIDLTNVKPGEPLTIKMKRISSVLRLAVKDKTTDKLVTDDAISSITFKCPTAKLSGKMTYNFVTGELTDTKANDNPNLEISRNVDIKMPFYADEDPVYFCTKPVDLKQGDVLTINIKTRNGYELQKDVTIGAQGVSFAPGMITTLNISVDDNTTVIAKPLTIADPTPDAAIDPIVTANNIVMQQKGRLTSKMIAKAMETGNTLKIKGEMNAFDLYSLGKIIANRARCNADLIDLDMSEVNVIGGDGAEYIDFYYNKLKTFRNNNMLPGRVFQDCNKLRSIILPVSLEKVVYCAFVSSSLCNITFGKNIQTLEEEAFKLSYKYDTYVTFLAKYREGLDIESEFIYFKCNDKEKHLKLNVSWSNSENYTPKGTVWRRIYWDGGLDYIDDNGNIVEPDNGGANLNDIVNGGAGI